MSSYFKASVWLVAVQVPLMSAIALVSGYVGNSWTLPVILVPLVYLKVFG